LAAVTGVAVTRVMSCMNMAGFPSWGAVVKSCGGHCRLLPFLHAVQAIFAPRKRRISGIGAGVETQANQGGDCLENVPGLRYE